MAWFWLVFAGLLEVVWAYSMKESAGFTRLWPSVITIVTMIIGFVMLAVAMRTLPLSTAYAIWVGIGAVGTYAVGALLLGERVTPLSLLAVALIVAGLVLLKLVSPE